MTSRRGFLGALAATPAMARAGLTGAGGALAQSNQLSAGNATGAVNYASLNDKIADQKGWLVTRAAEVAKNIAGLRTERSSIIREQLHNLVRLDPDLAESRALSLSTRIRLQAERNADRVIEQRSGWLKTELAEIKRQIGIA